MARKRPMTTEEFFDRINGILKEKGKLPDILDYGLAAIRVASITTYEFDLRSNLGYGGSEGIYLDLWMEYYEDGEKRANGIGTFKTLLEDDDAMHRMSALLADFIIEEYAYVNAHLDDFTWEGADVYPFDETGERKHVAYSCKSMESAMKRKEELLKRYPKVVVRNNCTRKETVYERKTEEGEEHYEA